MKKSIMSYLLNAAGIVAIAAYMLVSPASAYQTEEASNAFALAETGYIDSSYGLAVKPEPSAYVPQSKLWWNDGFWWGILFNRSTSTYAIHWLDWGNQAWVNTGIAVDSRVDDSTLVATRFDVLWDAGSNQLYIASHIKQDNPSQVKSEANWGRLYRYSYQANSNTYSLDTGFPAPVNVDKTMALVLDKDSLGRLWVTYISRVPDTDPLLPPVYTIYLNYTITPGDDLHWATPLSLATFNTTGATVKASDIASLIAFGSKVGVMWSNGVDGHFYFAEHAASSAPDAGWSIQAITNPAVHQIANGHIKLVKNNSGQIFAAIKTDNTNPTDPVLGVLARDTDGSFSFHKFSEVSSVDTRPSLVLNESENKLYMFATSNEAGGVICYKSMTVTAPLATMAFPVGNCSTNPLAGAPHFIASSVYTSIDNATSTKQNVTNDTGLVVLASDDLHGQMYLHNTMGNPLPVVTQITPSVGGTLVSSKLIVSVTFSHAMDASTITTSTFRVTGPGGVVAGTVSYNAGTRTATFTGSNPPQDGAGYTASLGAAVRDTAGRSLYAAGESWPFTMALARMIFIPSLSK